MQTPTKAPRRQIIQYRSHAVVRATGIPHHVAKQLDRVADYLAGVGYGDIMTAAEARGFAHALSLLHEVHRAA